MASDKWAEQKLSTERLTWFDEMIRNYATLQWAAKNVLEGMNRQTRHDEQARQLLHDVYELTSAKLIALNEARDKQFVKHERLMAAILDSEA